MDPEDILSEAFLRAGARWSEYDPQSMSTYTWLYRIVLDCLIDAWRKAHAGGRSIEREVLWPERSSVQLGLGLVGSTTSPSEAFDRAELRRRITWAVQQLKPNDREILGMRHFDELSPQETAAALGITPDAAMQRCTRRAEAAQAPLEPDRATRPIGARAMTADDSTATPLSHENVYVAFIKDFDSATDPDQVVGDTPDVPAPG